MRATPNLHPAEFVPLNPRISHNAAVSRSGPTLFAACLSVLLCVGLAAQTPPAPDLVTVRSFVRSLPIGPGVYA